MTVRIPISLFAATLLCPGLSAQQDEPTAAVAEACAKMTHLGGIAFSTLETQDIAMMRRFGGMGMNQDIEIDGTSSAEVVHASLNVDEDEIVIHKGRMIARAAGGEWKLRHNVLANGGRLPFVFDPGRFFETLESAPAEQRKVVNQEATNWRNKDLIIYSMTLEGEAAQDFNFCGAVPPVSGGARMIMMGGMGGGGPQQPPKVTIDVALYVDPATDLVHRIKVKSYQESSLPDGMRVQIAGADVEEEEPEKVEELDAEGKRIYKKGLPVRNLGKDTSVMDFDVRLSEHGKSAAPELDDRAKKLVGLKQTR